MTTAKSMTAKLAVGFVAVAMLFAFSAPVQAQSSIEAQIQALLAQIAALQGQLGGSSASAACPFTWTRDLSQGSTGEDVRKLQQFLNSDPETRVAVSGAGSVGQETTFYGPATAAAVSKFQVKYRAEVLTPGGLVNPTGYFGPASRAKANSLCSTGSPTTPTPGGPLQGGEGLLEDPNLLGDVEAVVDEGDTEQVLGVEFEAKDSDIRIERVDVKFTIASGGSIRLDRYVDTVDLYLNGTRIGRMSAGDSSRNNRTHTLRFTGLNGVVREGQTGELYVRVTAVDSIGDDEEDKNIEVEIPVFGIRAVDASGLSETYFDDSIDITNDFSVDAASEADLKIGEGDDNPAARVVEVDEDDTTSNIELLEFTMEPGNGDVVVDDLPVRLTAAGTGSPEVDHVLQSIALKRGSQTLQTRTIPASATSSSVVTFTNLNLNLDEDEEETFTIVATARALSADFLNGNSITAELDDTEPGWVVEDADGELIDVDGSAQGETVTFAGQGISVEFVSSSKSVTATHPTTGVQTGQFVIKFNVTAFGTSAYISNNATTAASSTLTNATTTARTITSNATVSGSGWRVNSGQTREFTLTVNGTGQNLASVLSLVWVDFGVANGDFDSGTAVELDQNVFKTDPQYLVGPTP